MADILGKTALHVLQKALCRGQSEVWHDGLQYLATLHRLHFDGPVSVAGFPHAQPCLEYGSGLCHATQSEWLGACQACIDQAQSDAYLLQDRTATVRALVAATHKEGCTGF